MVDSELSGLCKQIVQLDPTIRFAGIADKYGKQIAAYYREGLVPYLNQKESEIYSIDAVMRMNTRKEMESRLGQVVYSFTLYEKLKRATLYLENVDYPVLMVSFEIHSNHEDIILSSILPMVKDRLRR
jgi:hypothetical protein